MISPSALNSLIRSAVLANVPDSTYLRATDQEANISADGLDLADQVFVLYNNRPIVEGTLGQNSGLVQEAIPVEISFLCLADFDDNDEDGDQIMDLLHGHAQVIFDRLSLNEVLAEYVESYTIEWGDTTTKIYDKVMTGVKLSFDILTQRGVSC